MDTPRKFRTAFNGFNREDVVHYLEYINAHHAAQINELNAEIEALRSAQSLPADDDAQLLQARCEAMAAQLEEAEAANAELQARLDALDAGAAPAELAPPQEDVSAQLDAYRRAERTEREARERAELTYFQASSVLSEATAKVENLSAQITQQADQVMTQVTQLQVAISGSKHVLQDAAAIMNTIRPNQ